MSTDETASIHPSKSDQSGLERLISKMEVFGLNAARLILSATITLAVIAFVLGLFALLFVGIDYERKTNPAKYVVSSVSFTPHFSNVVANGRAQIDADGPIKIDRVAAARKDRDELITQRLTAMHEAGVCVGTPEQCHDLDFQRKVLTDGFAGPFASRTPAGSPVSFSSPLNSIDLAPYYGSYGFSNMEDSLRAEWEAVNECLGAYKAKNGNLYVSKTPVLLFGIVAQCHADYREAVSAELGAAPTDWSVEDSVHAWFLKALLASCGASIILIALTIIFFRLEVSFRSLRNLDRLK